MANSSSKNRIEAIRLRDMTESDAKIIFDWRNSSFIVDRSTSRSTVEWSGHVQWMQKIVTDPSYVPFIIELGKQPIGQIRYDKLDTDSFTITSYLDEKYTGKGYGVTSIQKGNQIILERYGDVSIYAFVRKANQLGNRAFPKAGFQRAIHPSTPEDHNVYLFSGVDL